MKTFKQFQEAAFAIPAATGLISKFALPAAAAIIGGVGTYMQAKKKYGGKGDEKMKEIARQQGLDLTDPRQRRKATSLVHQQKMKDRVNNPDGVKNRDKLGK